MDKNIRDLFFQAIDQTISTDDFERLQDAIEQSSELRLEYLRAVSLCESLGDIAAEEVSEPTAQAASSTAPLALSRPDARVLESHAGWDLRSPEFLATAATILVLVGGIAFWFGGRNVPDQLALVAIDKATHEETEGALISGHATLRRSVDLQWSQGTATYREGDLLPHGLLEFDNGVAEIDFFCGATLIVEGPATLDIESDWSVRVVFGRLRANVPPAARGFVVRAAGSEIVDLGTEFALEVGSDNARVEVIDGEVELRGGAHDGDRLATGQRQLLKGTQMGLAPFDEISTGIDLGRRREDALAQRFADWKKDSQRLSTDDRLIAYYPIGADQIERVVRNAALTGKGLDGLLVGPVDRTTGRFGSDSAGLEFDHPGARVRTRIDGEFQAFTFACWARIDSLEHRYNALFMSDGYENGELHWQIRDDGRLMFSVMVDDTAGAGTGPEPDARLHRIYFTEPIWDPSKSGQWFHLAAVYDPVGRRVVQYVNGERLSSEEITDDFHVTSLRIGPAEIGNWGQPFRKTPWFSVRNLNGTIDELAIFDSPLASEEIQALYEQGKPLGY